MVSISRDDIIERLRAVKDPELHRDIVSLKMVKDVSVEDGLVRVHVELTTPACPLKEQIRKDVDGALRSIPGVREVELEWSAQVRSSRPMASQLPGVKNIIAVGAGKGGVGKSTLAVLLAVGLRRAGATVGLMDADVYGPSIPTLTGIEGARPRVENDRMIPVAACGLQIMSIGFMVDRDKALIWRGPMVHGVVRQFIDQVEWGALDYLVVDLPPGTGDAPLTLCQALPLTGAVLVCTPQDVALNDARRAARMFEQFNVHCLGIVENMSYYLCPHCGHRDELFDHGGAAAAAAELGVPFLGEIPLNAAIRVHGDAGTPDRVFDGTEGYVREAIDVVVANLAGQVSIESQLNERVPTLTVE
jgi:ATP-binding protein involved in chromosome partitioning